MAPDPLDPAERALGRPPRDIYIPDLRLGSGIVPGQPTEGIKIKPRDFQLKTSNERYLPRQYRLRIKGRYRDEVS